MSANDSAAASPSKGNATNELNQKLLEALIKQIPDKGIDWNRIAEDMGSTAGAARERWRRYRIAHNIPTVIAPADDTPAKKARTPKRKAAEDFDNEPSTPTKKTPAKKSKAVKSDEKVAEDGDEKKAVATKKKAAPKKSAPAKTKPAPKTETVSVKEDDADADDEAEAVTNAKSDIVDGDATEDELAGEEDTEA